MWNLDSTSQMQVNLTMGLFQDIIGDSFKNYVVCQMARVCDVESEFRCTNWS